MNIYICEMRWFSKITKNKILGKKTLLVLFLCVNCFKCLFFSVSFATHAQFFSFLHTCSDLFYTSFCLRMLFEFTDRQFCRSCRLLTWPADGAQCLDFTLVRDGTTIIMIQKKHVTRIDSVFNKIPVLLHFFFYLLIVQNTHLSLSQTSKYFWTSELSQIQKKELNVPMICSEAVRQQNRMCIYCSFNHVLHVFNILRSVAVLVQTYMR